jgi:catechol 2,3-dioxygenase-like lactoylglutathione lyase family enzyme
MINPIRSLVPFLHVRDVAASLEFYGKLGFATENTFTPDGAGEPAWAWLRSERAELMLGRASAPIVAGEQAVMFYTYVNDVPAKHAELREAGLAPTEITHPFYAPRGEFRVFDPDGYSVFVTHTGE